MTPTRLAAIRGRIVTMDAAGTVIPDGVVYIRDNSIESVVPATAGAPAGFEGVAPVQTGGTVYPGLIELHNHLSYNCLQLWHVPALYSNRGQWSDPARNPQYRTLISGPMQVIGKSPDTVPSLVRYVEAKCLVAGVTTSQGIRLASDPAIPKFYRGVIRSTDEPGDAALKAAPGRIGDVAASHSADFARELAGDNRLLLHLAEGVDATARSYFTDLKLEDGTWAISDHLVGIHSVALQPDDIAILRHYGASMVWSPLSNLLLYGKTANVAEFHRREVPIGLGSDWSPSGSKNLLGELKVADWINQQTPNGPIFKDSELVQMVTSQAAMILDWQDVLGSLEKTKRADLTVIGGADKDPNRTLIEATERDVALTMIAGIGCAGRAELMTPYAAAGEQVTVGGETRVLNFDTPDADPTVKLITLAQATQKLTEALGNLKELAVTLPKGAAREGGGAERMTLALDEVEDTGLAMRTKPAEGFDLLAPPEVEAALPSLAEVLGPLALDALTAVDDAGMFTTLSVEPNLPHGLADHLASAYQ